MGGGARLLLLAMCLVPFVDATAKSMTGAHAPFYIAFLRYLAAGLCGLVVLVALGRRLEVPRRDVPGQILRTALLMGAMSALIAAFGRIPMADAVCGFFTAPIVASVISMTILGERATPARLLGVALGLVGAMVVLRPGFDPAPGAVLALCAGGLFGVYLAATRKAAATGCDLSTLIIQCLLGAAMLAPAAAMQGGMQISTDVILGAGLMGGISASCHFLTIAAYRREEASSLSHYLYFNLIAASLVGAMLFDETLTTRGLLGMGLILVGGVVMSGVVKSGIVKSGRAMALGRIWRPGNSKGFAAFRR